LELLQAYLDGELEEETARELGEHLAGCRSCRRELSRLKLLWLELGEEEETPLPPEWPYLRQQVVAAAMAAHRQPPERGLGFWETQRLAWQPFSLAAAYLPGTAGAVNLAKAAGRELPGLVLGLAGRTGRLLRKQGYRGGKGGPSQ
jgi:anti-sigma factor RsiW